jgi:hypothetical protein
MMLASWKIIITLLKSLMNGSARVAVSAVCTEVLNDADPLFGITKRRAP